MQRNRVARRYTGEMDFKFASKTLILAIACGSFALTAFAQWQWMDKDGRKVFSDRSPPADIQEKDILKRPGGGKHVAAAPLSANMPASPEAAAPATAGKAIAPKLSGKDAQLEARKKQAEEEDAAKKKAEEEKVAKAKAENCERVKRSAATLKSGARVTTANAKGELEILDDAARAKEIKRVQEIIAADCV